MTPKAKKQKKVWFQTSFLNELEQSLATPQQSLDATQKMTKNEHERLKQQLKLYEPSGPSFSNETEYIKRNENNRRIGESHPRSKYTDHEVELILQLRDLGMTIRKIAKKMDVPFSTVGAICSGRSRNQYPSKVTRK